MHHKFINILRQTPAHPGAEISLRSVHTHLQRQSSLQQRPCTVGTEQPGWTRGLPGAVPVPQQGQHTSALEATGLAGAIRVEEGVCDHLATQAAFQSKKSHPETPILMDS